MRRWVSLGAILLVALRGETARAASPQRPVREAIHVRPGATCIDEEALAEQVRSWLDADSVEADLRVDVEGHSQDARFVSFRIWQKDQLIAERRFAPGPAECTQMHAVVGLAVALALKVSLRDELLGESSAPEPGRWSVGAAAAAAWDVVPGAAGGASLWGERSFARYFAARLGFSGLVAGANRFERVTGEFSSSSLAVEAALCVVPRLTKSVRARVCAGLDARALFVEGSGFADSKSTVVEWFSVSNSIGASVDLGPHWLLIGSISLVLPLERVRIVVAEPRGSVVEAREAAPAGGLLTIGGAYEF
jgi:hypothetical protein